MSFSPQQDRSSDYSDEDTQQETQGPRKRGCGLKHKWTVEEHDRLQDIVQRLNTLDPDGNRRNKWTLVATELGNGRTSKQCRERWCNVRPDAKKGGWEPEEENQLAHMHATLGPTWTTMARHPVLSNRAENAIKNHWNALIRCKSLGSRPSTLLTTYVCLVKSGRPANSDTLDSSKRLLEAYTQAVEREPNTGSLLRAIEAAARTSDRDFAAIRHCEEVEEKVLAALGTVSREDSKTAKVPVKTASKLALRAAGVSRPRGPGSGDAPVAVGNGLGDQIMSELRAISMSLAVRASGPSHPHGTLHAASAPTTARANDTHMQGLGLDLRGMLGGPTTMVRALTDECQMPIREAGRSTRKVRSQENNPLSDGDSCDSDAEGADLTGPQPTLQPGGGAPVVTGEVPMSQVMSNGKGLGGWSDGVAGVGAAAQALGSDALALLAGRDATLGTVTSGTDALPAWMTGQPNQPGQPLSQLGQPGQLDQQDQRERQQLRLDQQIPEQQLHFSQQLDQLKQQLHLQHSGPLSAMARRRPSLQPSLLSRGASGSMRRAGRESSMNGVEPAMTTSGDLPPVTRTASKRAACPDDDPTPVGEEWEGGRGGRSPTRSEQHRLKRPTSHPRVPDPGSAGSQIAVPPMCAMPATATGMRHPSAPGILPNPLTSPPPLGCRSASVSGYGYGPGGAWGSLGARGRVTTGASMVLDAWLESRASQQAGGGFLNAPAVQSDGGLMRKPRSTLLAEMPAPAGEGPSRWDSGGQDEVIEVWRQLLAEPDAGPAPVVPPAVPSNNTNTSITWAAGSLANLATCDPPNPANPALALVSFTSGSGSGSERPPSRLGSMANGAAAAAVQSGMFDSLGGRRPGREGFRSQPRHNTVTTHSPMHELLGSRNLPFHTPTFGGLTSAPQASANNAAMGGLSSGDLGGLPMINQLDLPTGSQQQPFTASRLSNASNRGPTSIPGPLPGMGPDPTPAIQWPVARPNQSVWPPASNTAMPRWSVAGESTGLVAAVAPAAAAAAVAAGDTLPSWPHLSLLSSQAAAAPGRATERPQVMKDPSPFAAMEGVVEGTIFQGYNSTPGVLHVGGPAGLPGSREKPWSGRLIDVPRAGSWNGMPAAGAPLTTAPSGVSDLCDPLQLFGLGSEAGMQMPTPRLPHAGGFPNNRNDQPGRNNQLDRLASTGAAVDNTSMLWQGAGTGGLSAAVSGGFQAGPFASVSANAPMFTSTGWGEPVNDPDVVHLAGQDTVDELWEKLQH